MTRLHLALWLNGTMVGIALWRVAPLQDILPVRLAFTAVFALTACSIIYDLSGVRGETREVQE